MNKIYGAPTRTRTANLLITNQLLYQLSYRGAESFLFQNIKLSKKNRFFVKMSRCNL